jgi:hypothetical protein
MQLSLSKSIAEVLLLAESSLPQPAALDPKQTFATVLLKEQ